MTDTKKTAASKLAWLYANGRMESFDRLMARILANGWTVVQCVGSNGLASMPAFVIF